MTPNHEELRQHLSALTASFYKQAEPLGHLHRVSEMLESCNNQERELIIDGLDVLLEDISTQLKNIEKIKARL